MFTNKIFQEIPVIFVSEVEQNYTVTRISSNFSDTVEVEVRYIFVHQLVLQ